jgi:glutathione peroxidase-family protein
VPRRAALCLAPDGLETAPEVRAAVADAGQRLARAGWSVEEIATTPPLREPADLNAKFWLGDGFEAQLAAAEKEGDPGALACLRGNRARVTPFDAAAFSAALARRATLTRQWLLFLEQYPVLLMPVSGELPFPDHLDRKDEASFARVWRAQLPQIAIPLMGLPGLTVSTGLVGRVPVGVQLVAGRYREDLLLLAGEAIEAGGTPPSPIDPVRLVVGETMAGIYDFTATSLAGEEVPLRRFEGQVLLIVNTASACGFTPQYEGLEALHRELSPRGFAVLGFPCNQFGGQEPGNAAAIGEFCKTKYDVTFPLFAKVDVNGAKAHPLYGYLKGEKSGLLGSAIKWNFTKFLVDRTGKVVGRFAPTATPQGLKKEIEALL